MVRALVQINGVQKLWGAIAAVANPIVQSFTFVQRTIWKPAILRRCLVHPSNQELPPTTATSGVEDAVDCKLLVPVYNSGFGDSWLPFGEQGRVVRNVMLQLVHIGRQLQLLI